MGAAGVGPRVCGREGRGSRVAGTPASRAARRIRWHCAARTLAVSHTLAIQAPRILGCQHAGADALACIAGKFLPMCTCLMVGAIRKANRESSGGALGLGFPYSCSSRFMGQESSCPVGKRSSIAFMISLAHRTASRLRLGSPELSSRPQTGPASVPRECFPRSTAHVCGPRP